MKFSSICRYQFELSAERPITVVIDEQKELVKERIILLNDT